MTPVGLRRAFSRYHLSYRVRSDAVEPAGHSVRTTACTGLDLPTIELPHPFVQVDLQRRTRHLGLRLGRTEYRARLKWNLRLIVPKPCSTL